MKNLPRLDITVNNTETGRLYFDLTKSQYQKTFPFYKDNAEWTLQRMVELANEAKQILGWEWLSDSYTMETAIMLHKDLEQSVGKYGFDSVPLEHHDLLYDIHHCLHAIQGGKTDSTRVCNFQLEWTITTDTIPLPSSFEFSETVNRGDLILINPYVGHNPLQLYMEQDSVDFRSTCKFHDIIRPSVVVSSFTMTKTKDELVDWMYTNDPGFVEEFGIDTIRYYSGSAVIGRVQQIEVFEEIMHYKNTLELDKVEFHG